MLNHIKKNKSSGNNIPEKLDGNTKEDYLNY